MSVTMDKDKNLNGINGKYLNSVEKDINTNGNGPENEKQSNIKGRKWCSIWILWPWIYFVYWTSTGFKMLLIFDFQMKNIHTASGFGRRHLQVALLFGGLLFAYSLRVNVSVGIVAMTDQTSNSTDPVSEIIR